MTKNLKASQGNSAPRESAQRRQECRIRVPFDEFLVVRAQDLRADEAARRVPWSAVLSCTDRWRSSLLAKQIAHEVYELGAGVRLDLLNRPRQGEPDHLDRWLQEAFQRGLLVALSTGKVLKGPLRSQQSPEGAAVAQSIPIVDHPAPPASPRPVHQPEPEPEPESETTAAFFAITLVDEDGHPIPHERYRLTLPDGSTREGALDAQGQARVENLTHPGECKLEFLSLGAAS